MVAQNKMEYDGHYAVMEVSFILDDPRLDALTPAQRWLYVVLWCRAVQLKQETIPAHGLAQLPRRVNHGHDQGATRELPAMRLATTTLAHLSRLDPRSIRPAISKLQQLCLINVEDNGDITVCGVRKKHPKLKWKKSNSKTKKRKKPPIYGDGDVNDTGTGTNTGKRRKRKIPDSDHARLIDYWVNIYENRWGNKYDFKGSKEGPIIKRLLDLYGFEKSCSLMETFLNTDDEFYRKAGWTLGVLSSQTNKLLQKPILADDPLSKFSPSAQQTILNMKNILEKDKQNAIDGET
jgi:hypothetical protein